MKLWIFSALKLLSISTVPALATNANAGSGKIQPQVLAFMKHVGTRKIECVGMKSLASRLVVVETPGEAKARSDFGILKLSLVPTQLNQHHIWQKVWLLEIPRLQREFATRFLPVTDDMTTVSNGTLTFVSNGRSEDSHNYGLNTPMDFIKARKDWLEANPFVLAFYLGSSDGVSETTSELRWKGLYSSGLKSKEERKIETSHVPLDCVMKL